MSSQSSSKRRRRRRYEARWRKSRRCSAVCGTEWMVQCQPSGVEAIHLVGGTRKEGGGQRKQAKGERVPRGG